ncbi:MAG: TauD/TfdA family dioxygenase, partial [Alphaproteobacteria bacterium]|nr:TauD/TfdA family dioxygenase [Alphaproteobacteria bacterium]
GQQLTPQQQIDFSRRFGPLDQHPADDAVLPGHPDILVVSTKRENGAYVGLPDGGPMWHSDLAYRDRPALGSMLYGIEVPAQGGNTGFANMYAAYDALPKALKDAVEGRRGVFLAGRNNAKRSFKRNLSQAQKDRTPAVTHPIIRTHPETGRKSIFASPQHTIAIEGMDETESDAILAELFAHSTGPGFVYHHNWRAGDLTFWDNRCVLHIADLSRLDDPAYIRHMHRTTIQGDAPI